MKIATAPCPAPGVAGSFIIVGSGAKFRTVCDCPPHQPINSAWWLRSPATLVGFCSSAQASLLPQKVSESDPFGMYKLREVHIVSRIPANKKKLRIHFTIAAHGLVCAATRCCWGPAT
jgi:hypothetical protein